MFVCLCARVCLPLILPGHGRQQQANQITSLGMVGNNKLISYNRNLGKMMMIRFYCFETYYQFHLL
jgi:hypothetical protein